MKEDIARAEFKAIMLRRYQLWKVVVKDSDWQRYRLVIHPELLKAIGDLLNGYSFDDPTGGPETFLDIPIIRDPNVEGWLIKEWPTR